MNNESPFEQTPEQRSLIGKLIRFCVTNKLVVGLFVFAVIVVGILVAPFDWNLGDITRYPVPTDAIPDIGENQQIVFTEWMGRSPQDVEDQITYPMTVSLLGIPGVKTIRSYSFFGFSTVYVIFKEDVEFYWSRTRVLEKLNSLPAGTLPPGVQPVLGPDATALGQIYWYTLEGRDPDGNPAGGWDLEELRTIQDWYVRYWLLSADGVSEVASIGGYVREYQVDVDPDAMRAYGVTLTDVFKAVKASNIDVGAKTLELNRTEYFIRGIGFIEKPSDIENSVVKVHENVPILVSHVAKVTLGPAMRRGALDKGGAQAVGGVVVARYGDNPLKVIQNVKKKIEKTSEALPAKAVIDFSKVTRDEVDRFAKGRGFKGFNGAEINQKAWLGYLRSTPRIDLSAAPIGQADRFARDNGFEAFKGREVNRVAWMKHLRSTPRSEWPAWVSLQDEWPEWVTLSKVTVVPFYDRTGLIYETLGTLDDAISQEILITIIVIIVMVMHLRSGFIISYTLPLAVLLAFIGMKFFGVDANIVALSGIAIAIGTIVDMGIVVCENTLRHLQQAPPEEPRVAVVHRAASEVGGAVLTAVLTTVISFLPVFTMIGAEGKLFKPLAYTKTFALFASIIIALTVVPPTAYMLFCGKISSKRFRQLLFGLIGAIGLALVVYGLSRWSFLITTSGLTVILLSSHSILKDWIPRRVERFMPWLANGIVVVLVGVLLTQYWEPLGPQRGLLRNLVFVGVLIGGLLGFFHLFRYVYSPILRWCLRHKLLFLSIPTLTVFLGVTAWLGVGIFAGPFLRADRNVFSGPEEIVRLVQAGVLERQGKHVLWTESVLGKKPDEVATVMETLGVERKEKVLENYNQVRQWFTLRNEKWVDETKPRDKWISNRGFGTKIKWTIARSWDGFGKEFMPPLDEGSYLFMPTTMVHASIGEALDILAKQDMALQAIPEIDSVVGKLGRAETPLDPAPISMIETVINYKPQYVTDKAGRRVNFRYEPDGTRVFSDEQGRPVPATDGKPYRVAGRFPRDDAGRLIPDSSGQPFRLWRPALDPAINPEREKWDGIKTPNDIWDEIVKAAKIPGSTSAPKLQPIAARIVMLQSGMRAPMGVKVYGPSLEAIEKVGLQIERFLKEVPSVEASAVVADRIVGKPYLEIVPDRVAIARYGVPIRAFQDVVEIAIGGRKVTTTIEGRERFPVRVRYQRELRDDVEKLARILVPGKGGSQIPIAQLAEIRYIRGPQVIKSEDTFLVGYVVFDKKPGYAEVDVVEECQRYLQAKIDSGELTMPRGVSYNFAGSYENQLRAQKTLSIVLPVALFVIFMIIYFQFKSISTTLLVFSGIFVAWAGGFLLIWCYGQPWFLDFSVFGVHMRELFQVHTINLSVAVWVGFLALFGIASDNGVIQSTYLDQVFRDSKPDSIETIREATVSAAHRRVRPCLMTSATTILALIPILTSIGRGSDVMVPMAIPSFGGMLVVLISIFVVPVLYCAIKEFSFKR